jgi:hypothetical protein
VQSKQEPSVHHSPTHDESSFTEKRSTMMMKTTKKLYLLSSEPFRSPRKFPSWPVVRAVACMSACLGVTACQTVAQRVSDKEDLLAAAGFSVQPANTPQRLDSLRTLPPNKFIPKTQGDGVAYIYADPIVCTCLYVGDQSAFDAYKREIFARQIVDQQQLTAETYSEQWNWGGWNQRVWGPRIW